MEKQMMLASISRGKSVVWGMLFSTRVPSRWYQPTRTRVKALPNRWKRKPKPQENRRVGQGLVTLPDPKQPQGWRRCPPKILYSPKTPPLHPSPVSPMGAQWGWLPSCPFRGAGSPLILLSSMGKLPQFWLTVPSFTPLGGGRSPAFGCSGGGKRSRAHPDTDAASAGGAAGPGVSSGLSGGDQARRE